MESLTNTFKPEDTSIYQWTGVIIGSGNGLAPVRRQAITWTNDDLLLFRPFRRNFSEIWIKIQNFSFKKLHLKMST